MRTTLLLLSVAVALTLGACGSNKSTEATTIDVPCVCGTDEAMLDGCAHPLCISREGNPENPDCVCGTMEFAGDN